MVWVVEMGLRAKNAVRKRQKKNKVVAMRALTGGKRKEVIFDEHARTEWLSGFHKRKQERRKYGLAMEVLKKQKSHKEMMKEQRAAFQEERNKLHNKLINGKSTAVEGGSASENDEPDSEEDPEVAAAEKFTASVTSGKNQEVSVFEDPSTVSMFGSTVSVVVDTSIGDEGEEDDSEDGAAASAARGGRQSSINSSNNKKPLKRVKAEPTRFEKAMKIAKAKMGQRPKKHRDNSIQGKKSSLALKSKVDGSKLLSKVLQKPMKGKHSGGRRRK
mmetsp:Transcript_18552/g.37337  ORF Transcript_18552/g.37337 Transcript_18552/m.37337 type:complete len:273 (+) Transcript_18552:56-874(+)